MTQVKKGILGNNSKNALFRKHLYSYEPEGFSWLDAMKLYNSFLWSQFEYMEAKMFDLDESRIDEYGMLINQFLSMNDEYNLKESILRKEFEELSMLEQKTTEEKEKEIKRSVQREVIRRIPGYEFFEPFKHGCRTCKTHGKNMTAKKLMEEHLFGESGNWQGKFERIQTYVGEVAKPFYSKVQKSMRESAQKLAKRIKQLIEVECEPYRKILLFEAIILKGEFRDFQGRDLRTFFKIKGSCILETQIQHEQQ